MKSIFRLLLAGAVAATVISTAAFAQMPQRPAGKGADQGCRMGAMAANRLNLTDQQRQQIKEKMQACRSQAMDIRNSNLAPQDKQAKLQALRQSCRQSVSQVLTPAQREQAKQNMQQRRQAGPRGQNWGPGQGRGFRGQGMRQMMQKLNLTPQQKERIKSIHQQTRERVMNIRSDNRLTQAEKSDKIASVRRVGRNQMMQVLTPAQQAQVKTWKQNHPQGQQFRQGGQRRPGSGQKNGAGFGMANPTVW